MRVDEADVAAAGDAEVRVSRLAGPVDGAAEHGDLESLGVGIQPLLDLGGQRLHADVVASAGGARDEDGAPLPQAERLEDLPGDLDLLHGVGRQRHAHRVADPVHEQRAHANRALDPTRERRSRFGDAEVQRVRHLGREHPVGPDHRRHVARLHGDLEVAVVECLQQPHLLEGRLDERLGLVFLRQGRQVLGQRARVGADAHRHACPLRRLDDELDLVGAADVAGVDADGGDAGIDRLQSERGVEVDIGDDGQRRKADDLRQRVGVLRLRNRHTHHLAARRRESGNLRRGRLHIVRLRQRHRLHGDGRPAADRDAADGDLPLAGHPPAIVDAPQIPTIGRSGQVLVPGTEV